MSAHTLGPWHTGGTFFHNGDEHMSVWSAPLPGDQSGDQVCQYAKPEDARLIAVTPDLWAIVQTIARLIDQGAPSALILDENSPTIDAIRDVIAKVQS